MYMYIKNTKLDDNTLKISSCTMYITNKMLYTCICSCTRYLSKTDTTSTLRLFPSTL